MLPGRPDRRARRPRAVTNSGGPPIRVATTGARSPSPRGAPGRTARSGDGWQTTSAAAIQRGTSIVRDTPRRRGLRRGPRAAVAGARRRRTRAPLPQRVEGAREPDGVLALDERADAEEGRAGTVPAELARAAAGSCPRKRSRSTPESIDLGLAARLRHLRLELAAQVVGDGDDARPRGGRRGGSPPPIPGIAPTLRTSRPWAVTTSGARDGQSGDQAGRDEEVGVDDVRPEAARGRARVPGELAGSGACRRRGGRGRRARSRGPAPPALARAARTKTPRSGSAGPGYICETRRMRIV